MYCGSTRPECSRQGNPFNSHKNVNGMPRAQREPRAGRARFIRSIIHSQSIRAGSECRSESRWKRARGAGRADAREPLSPPRPVPATPGCRTDSGRHADRRRAARDRSARSRACRSVLQAARPPLGDAASSALASSLSVAFTARFASRIQSLRSSSARSSQGVTSPAVSFACPACSLRAMVLIAF